MKNIFNKIKKENIIYASLFILLLFAICYSMIKDKKTSMFYNKTYDQDTPIIINIDNKLGYISPKNGRIIINPIYNYAKRFYGNYAIVKVNKNNNEYYKIIDKYNNKKIEFNTYTPYQYISEYNLWLIDGVLYDKDFMPLYKKENQIEYISYGLFSYKNISSKKSGIFNYLNQKLFEFNDSKIEVDKKNVTENSIVVKSNNNYYLCSVKNKKILYKVNSNDYSMELLNDNVIKLISKNEKKRYIVFDKNKVIYETSDSIENIEVIDKYIVLDYGYNYNINNKKQRYYYYDIKAKKLTKDKPVIKNNNINDYGYELVYKNNKVGIKKYNNIIVKPKCNDIEFIQLDLFDYIKNVYNQELVLLYNKSEVKLYDLKNAKTIETYTIKGNDYIKIIQNTPYFKIKKYDEDGNSSLVLYNIITKKSMEFIDYDSFYVDINYVIIKKNNKNVYYNSKFKKIYESN